MNTHHINFTFIYWALALLGALGAAVWKAAGLRGELHQKWSDRVDFIRNGLSDLGVQELKRLRLSIDTLLGDQTNSAIADPTDLRQPVRDFLKITRIQRSVPFYFKIILKIGNLAVIALLMLMVSIGLLGLFHSNVLRFANQETLGVWLLIAGIVTGVACFLCYWFLENRLSGAEIMSTGRRPYE